MSTNAGSETPYPAISSRAAGVPRPRTLLSAYACHPDRGSEPGVGWEWLLATTAWSDVCVLTRTKHAAAVRAALVERPELAVSVEVVGVECSTVSLAVKRRVPGFTYLYYVLWQRQARRMARRLHEKHPFDVAHHITFAIDWLPAGVVGIPGLPSVWGPVGGATRTPTALLPSLGVRGAAAAVSRDALTGVCRRTVGRATARRADLVVVANADGQRAFGRYASRVVVEPNLAMPDAARVARPATPDQPRGRLAMFAGRLLPWKGVALAIDAVALDDAGKWHLDVYGEGPDRGRLERRARRRGVAERVCFRGMVPRADLLAALDTADAFLFPSVHDSAPWAVGEALASGCPVVCLDVGGPPVLVAGGNGIALPVREGGLPARLLTALEDVAGRERRATDRWSRRRLPELVTRWHRAVAPAGQAACP
jgi:glycosyltransferase involved in cell wall biosynthesis